MGATKELFMELEQQGRTYEDHLVEQDIRYDEWKERQKKKNEQLEKEKTNELQRNNIQD